jgi:hypothetical protein
LYEAFCDNGGMADEPVTELVLSPRWAVTVGDIEGSPHVVMRIQHPRLGSLDFLLPGNEPVELAAALEKTWERRDEKRLGGAALPMGDSTEPAQPPRPLRFSWWSRLAPSRLRRRTGRIRRA